MKGSKALKSLTKNNKRIIENMSYMTFLQLFLLIYPLITYPYLVKVLGRDLYGIVLTAQMLASYASLIIDFGSNSVCAKHVSINRDDRDKLSEIICNIIIIKLILFVLAFFIYLIICLIVPLYRDNIWIFLLSYGFATNELLFPQFFFQGLEKMKFISIINITTKLLFVSLIFILVKSKHDVLMVPIIYSLGFVIGGGISLFQIFGVMKIKIVKPSWKSAFFYIKDSSAIFATDLICTIKDKFNYFLIGQFVGMSEVVVYDLGLRLNSLASKPYSILCTVLLPHFARKKSINQLKYAFLASFIVTLLLFIIANIFLDKISYFFLHEQIDLLPLRFLLLAPLLLSISVPIANIMFIGFGYNKYVFYSIIVTTVVYLISLLLFGITNGLNNIMSFIYIALIAYFVELVYRLIKARNVYFSEIVQMHKIAEV